MPCVDGTGPNGMGGWCTPLWKSGQMERPMGSGGRFSGRRAPGLGGRGRGRMSMFYATGQPGWRRYPFQEPQAEEIETTKLAREQEIAHLEQESKLLQQQVEEIKKRIEELKT